MKKKRHKYKLGTKLEFKFFDGTKKVGLVTKQDYKKIPPNKVDYKIPTYTISNIERKRKWNYPCITEEMIYCKLN